MRHVLAVLALLAVAASPRGGGCGKTPYEPCAGKTCGTACTLCAPDDRDCVETMDLKACDPSGACATAGSFTCPAPPPLPVPCEGKRCGDPCTIDPPCRSAVPPCMMPSLLGRCDAAGSCVAADPVCAPPGDPCAGKACGETCNPCGDASPCPTFAATACDRRGECVIASSVRCP